MKPKDLKFLMESFKEVVKIQEKIHNINYLNLPKTKEEEINPVKMTFHQASIYSKLDSARQFLSLACDHLAFVIREESPPKKKK